MFPLITKGCVSSLVLLITMDELCETLRKALCRRIFMCFLFSVTLSLLPCFPSTCMYLLHFLHRTCITLKINFKKPKNIWKKLILNFKIRSFWGLDAGIRAKEMKSWCATWPSKERYLYRFNNVNNVCFCFVFCFFRLHLINHRYRTKYKCYKKYSYDDIK